LVIYKVITTFDEFLRLEQAWNELVVGSEVDHTFMKHQWFAELIKAYRLESSLSIITAWAEGQLVAVAPIHRRLFVFRKIKAKGLSFLTCGITPRANFITADSALVAELVKHLLQLSGWDVFVAENMEAEIETTRKFLELLDRHLNKYGYQIVRGFHSPYLTTEGSWDDYWNQLSPKRRKSLRNCLNRLEKADSCEINRVTTPEAFKAFLQDMFEISGKSWKADSGGHLTFDSPQGQFYANFTPIGLEHDWITLYTIRINNKLIGFEYLLSCNNKYSVVRADYNEEYHYYSPPSSLRIAILKDLFSKPETCEYDLCGDDYLYKLRWCGKIRKHVTITVGNRNIKGRTVMFAKNTVLPFLRNLKETLRKNSGVEKA
jgi:CelD/BcsL family acetyltransferase involved in cellulose biosynthesis